MRLHGARIDERKMREAADDATALLKALANPHRLMIVCQLIAQERSVGELATLLGLRDSTVSQHLALLRKDGLVGTRREGQTIWYSVSSAPAGEIVHALYRLYCAPGSRPRAAKSARRDPDSPAGRRRR